MFVSPLLFGICVFLFDLNKFIVSNKKVQKNLLFRFSLVLWFYEFAAHVSVFTFMISNLDLATAKWNNKAP